MNWDFTYISKDSIEIRPSQSYIADLKANIVVATFICTIGFIILVTLGTLGLLIGFVMFLAGALLFKTAYDRYSRAAYLAIFLHKDTKQMTILAKAVKRTIDFTQIKGCFSYQGTYHKSIKSQKSLKGAVTIFVYSLRMSFTNNEHLTLRESTDHLTLPEYNFLANALNQFIGIGKGKELNILVNEFKPLQKSSSILSAIFRFFNSLIPELFTNMLSKETTATYSIRAKISSKNRLLLNVIPILIVLSFFIAYTFSPWSSVLRNNSSPYTLADLIVMMAFSFLSILLLVILIMFLLKQPVNVLLDTGSDKIMIMQSRSNVIITLPFNDIEYGRIGIQANHLVLEFASRNVKLRKTFKPSPYNNQLLLDIQKIAEKKAILKPLKYVTLNF